MVRLEEAGKVSGLESVRLLVSPKQSDLFCLFTV